MDHPPIKPKALAVYNVKNASALTNLNDPALPEPHVRDDSDERGYIGIYETAADIAESRSVWTRVPTALYSLICQIATDPEEVYAGSVGAFIRHAIFELLYVHYERRMGRRGIPEIVQYLRQMELTRGLAWEMYATRGLKDLTRALTTRLAQCIEAESAMDIDRTLDDFNRLLQGSTSDTYSAQFKQLLRSDSVIVKAINLLVAKWTDSEDVLKRQKQEKWSSWLQGLMEE